MPLVKKYVPAVEFLKNFKGKILLASHENPDGDTVGSALALYLYLKKLGKEVYVGCKDPVPYYLQFLPSWKDYITLPTDDNFDLCVVVDAAHKGRIGAPVKAKQFMRIDHHKGGEFYGEQDIVDVEAPATASVVYYILKKWEPNLIDSDIATCLYTGIASDTGFFVNSNTDKRALKEAYELVENYNLNPHLVAVNVKERNPVRRLKLLAKALETLKLHFGGKVASMYVLKEWLEKLGATYEDTEGFVNYARSIDGVDVALFVIEREDHWKVSLRSKERTDVSLICEKFSGGGHKYAAGCRIPKTLTLEQALEKLLSEIETELKLQGVL